MLKLHYANHMEALIEPLLVRIEALQVSDPFTPITIIVPNASVAHFIRFQVAQKLGVSAHINFHYLRRFLTEQVQEADPRIRILETESLQLLLFEHLNTPEVLQRIELEPVRTYLDIAESLEEREGRCIQLAQQLAQLFEEYGYARRDMLKAWREGKSGLKAEGEGSEDINRDRGPWLRAEKWQRILWRGLFDDDGSIRIYPLKNHLIEGLEGLTSPEVRRDQSLSSSKSARRQRSKAQQPALFLTEADQGQADPRAHLRRNRKKGDEVARWMFLPEAIQATESKLNLPENIFVFGLSYVALAYAYIFSKLSALTQFHIFALNPCCEFWEDVDHRLNVARQGWISRSAKLDDFIDQDDPFNLEDPDDTPALRLWGRPGREYIRLLNQLTDCEFESCYRDPIEYRQHIKHPQARTTLSHVQSDILNRVPARPPLAEDLEHDGTIRLLACPGIRREVEIVADEIWRLVSSSKSGRSPIRFHEIAVMVTDAKRQEYLTHIESIFKQRYGLPFNMIDRSLSAQSRVLEGAIRLLALPLGELSYSEVINVACHPMVGSKTGVNLDQWRRWGDQLNVRFGADKSALDGTYIKQDVYHWDQGLKRLLLGLFMEGERSGDERVFTVKLNTQDSHHSGLDSMNAWVPFDMGGDQFQTAGQMIHLIRCLLLDAKQVSQSKLSLAMWCKYFTRLFTHYLKAQSSADEQAISRCIETIDELKHVDLEGTPIRYEVAQTMLKARLKRLDSTRGQHQADGIVVSSMLPMRAIPFNTIFILGLGEQDFPAKTPQNPIDLRQAQQLPGDVSPSQRDRYLFLETVLSARERLVLSYVSADDRTGDLLEPSAVVRELHFILRGYLGPSGLKAERHPLSAYNNLYDQLLSKKDPSPNQTSTPWLYTPVCSPEVIKGIRAKEMRNRLNKFLGGTMMPREQLESAIKVWSMPGINQFLDLSTPPKLDRDKSAITRFRLSDLKAFLFSPLQGSAKALLKMSEPEIHDFEAILNDPLHDESYKQHNLLQKSFWRGGGDEAKINLIYEDLFKLASLKGEAPVDYFAAKQKISDQRILNIWRLNAHQFQLYGLDKWQAVSIGEGREFEEVSRRLPPIQLDVPLLQGGHAKVELVGRISPLRPDLGATMHCLSSGGVGEHLFLKGFLEMVFLAAAQQALPKTFKVYLNPTGDFRAANLQKNYYTPNPVEAREYLSLIVSHLISSGLHTYRLPIRSALKWKEALKRNQYQALIIRPEDKEQGPIKNLRPFSTPPSDFAIKSVTERLGPWFSSEVTF